VIRIWHVAVTLGLGLVLTTGCATYREDLNRGQRLYEENEYEHALAIFRVLENDTDSLELEDQSRYDYLRGMTDYRLGFRADARHWLAMAKATEQEHPGGLNPNWKQRLEEALNELNQEVYGGGGEAFGKSRSSATDTTTGPGDDAGAAAPGDKKGCTANTDCPDGQSCQAGECVPL
jgi:Cys-rich repeat protein